MDEEPPSLCELFLIPESEIKDEPNASSRSEDEIALSKLKPAKKKKKPKLYIKRMQCKNENERVLCKKLHTLSQIKKLKLKNKVQSKKIDKLEKISEAYKRRVTVLKGVVKKIENVHNPNIQLAGGCNKKGSTDGLVLMQGIEDTRKQRYSHELKSFAISLYMISSKAYNYMREVFYPCLPNTRTLQKWSENFDILEDENGDNNAQSNDD